MQAVILAAGRGTRMKELTEATPKPLLEVNGKPLLEYELEALPSRVTEVIIVVGYMGSVIQQRFGGTYQGKRLLYVEQETLDGAAGALWKARDVLNDRFIVMMSDDIYSRQDIETCMAHKDGWALLVQEREHMNWGGNVEIDKHHRITRVTEGQHKGKGRISTNLFCLDTRIFDFPLVPKAPDSDEYGLPQTAIAAAEQLGIPFYAVPATSWIQITEPDDLKKAEDILAAGN